MRPPLPLPFLGLGEGGLPVGILVQLLRVLQPHCSHGGQEALAPRWPSEVAVGRCTGSDNDPRYTVVSGAFVCMGFVFCFVGFLFSCGFAISTDGVYDP